MSVIVPGDKIRHGASGVGVYKRGEMRRGYQKREGTMSVIVPGDKRR